MHEELPEVTLLRDARGERPPQAVGIGRFWYDPGVWSLPLSPAARVLYAGLCSFLEHGEVHRKDLRNTLRDTPDAGIVRALEELVRHGLLVAEPTARESLASYAVRPVAEFEG